MIVITTSIILLIIRLITSLFCGFTLYATLIEHPSRMGLDSQSALTQWTASFKKAAVIQVALCLITTILCIVDYFFISHKLNILIGGIIFITILPYTLKVLMPTNYRLLSGKLEGDEIKEHLIIWEYKHRPRILIGLIALVLFLL